VANLSSTPRRDAIELLASVSGDHPMVTGIPDLSEFDYTFARAQQLGFEGNALIQLVYAKEGSSPLALCYMPGATEADRELAMSQIHDVGAASWVSEFQHFVVIADEPHETLNAIYDSVTPVFQ